MNIEEVLQFEEKQILIVKENIEPKSLAIVNEKNYTMTAGLEIIVVC